MAYHILRDLGERPITSLIDDGDRISPAHFDGGERPILVFTDAGPRWCLIDGGERIFPVSFDFGERGQIVFFETDPDWSLDGGERGIVALDCTDPEWCLDAGERGMFATGPNWSFDSGPKWHHFGPPEGNGGPQPITLSPGEQDGTTFLFGGPGENNSPYTLRDTGPEWELGPYEPNQKLFGPPEGDGAALSVGLTKDRHASQLH
ncbi:hypothetical protein P9G84_03770 [Brevibacillus centrosporus]|uniref:hypothetical protein n=1 Tax=Brevibacillus centrosporus TaxID=54910 RepID=UPI0011426E64|nr:hypothetical protein [Brevibacillus centrosporus]MEC2128109.1 hypothetical protein [Brevibacillus centrosporus]